MTSSLAIITELGESAAIFLADGRIRDRVEAPTARTVLDRMAAVETASGRNR